LEIDEDLETIWTSDRKEYDSEVDLEEKTTQTFGQVPESDMVLEPDQETFGRSGQDPEFQMDVDPALFQAGPIPPYLENSSLENFIPYRKTMDAGCGSATILMLLQVLSSSCYGRRF
jgi:hypothetical protein